MSRARQGLDRRRALPSRARTARRVTLVIGVAIASLALVAAVGCSNPPTASSSSGGGGASQQSSAAAAAKAFLAAAKKSSDPSAALALTVGLHAAELPPTDAIPADLDTAAFAVASAADGGTQVKVGPQGAGEPNLAVVVKNGKVTTVTYDRTSTVTHTSSMPTSYTANPMLPKGYELKYRDGKPGVTRAITSTTMVNGVAAGPARTTEVVVSQPVVALVARGTGHSNSSTTVSDLRVGTSVSGFQVTDPIKKVSAQILKNKGAYVTFRTSKASSPVPVTTGILQGRQTKLTFESKGIGVATAAATWRSHYSAAQDWAPGRWAVVVYLDSDPVAVSEFQVTP